MVLSLNKRMKISDDANPKNGDATNARISSLDALRGIAALVVVLHHMRLMYWQENDLIKLSPFRVLLAGSSSVIVFFILSGFVLQLAYFQNAQNYLSFVIKRVSRIYLPFAASIPFSAALYMVMQPLIPDSRLADWAGFTWSEWPSLHVLAKHLVMTDSLRFHNLNNIMWSLVIELRISIIFPVVALLSRNRRLEAIAFSLLLWVVCTWTERFFSLYDQFNPARTFKYIFCFVIGAIIHDNISAIRSALSSKHRTFRASVLSLGLVGYSISPDSLGGFTTIAGSAVLVAFTSADMEFAKLITRPVTLWLGKISYSLYLVHVPILIGTAHLVGGGMPRIVVVSIGMALALVFASIFQKVIERPSSIVGNYLATLVNQSVKCRRRRQS
jgi:peptidoglycan/LPS O-acetylase OafA/YrhL